MKQEELNKALETMQNKLGKEQSSIIADDLGILVTDNDKMNKDYADLMDKYQKAETRNQQLVEANSNLLKQVSAPPEAMNDFNNRYNYDRERTQEKKEIDIRTAFDEKGNFKR